MKFNIETITHVKMTVDNSELIMMNKGGMQKIELPGDFFDKIDLHEYEREEEDRPAFRHSRKIILSIQLDPDRKSMFDHCTDYKFQETTQAP